MCELKSLQPEVLKHIYMVSPAHVDYINRGSKVIRHTPLLSCHLELLGLLSEGNEKERDQEIKNIKDVGLLGLYENTRVPIHFYPITRMISIGEMYKVREARFVFLPDEDVIPFNNRNLVSKYRTKQLGCEFMPELYYESVLLKNPSRKLDVFGMHFSNEGAQPILIDGSYPLYSADLEFWKSVTKAWYERTHEGTFWDDLGAKAKQRHITNYIRHSSPYDHICGLAIDEETHFAVYREINLNIAKTFPYLRNEALRQIDEKEFSQSTR